MYVHDELCNAMYARGMILYGGMSVYADLKI